MRWFKWKFRRRKSACHIWLRPNKNGIDAQTQHRFNHMMRGLRLPPDLTEGQLVENLKSISEKINHQLCYHLSKNRIDYLTRFTFQMSEHPRVDDVISRQ